MRLLGLLLVGVLALAGCSRGGTPTAELEVVVANQAGMAMSGVAVKAQQINGSDLVDLESTGTTDEAGSTVLTLPVNVVVSVGLSADPESGTRWQQQVTVPAGGVTLYYQYPVPEVACAVVDPVAGCPPTE